MYERIWRAEEVVCFTDRIKQSGEVPIKSILDGTLVYYLEAGVFSHVRTDPDAAGPPYLSVCSSDNLCNLEKKEEER